MSITDQIIASIKQNRISTTEIADALGKSGVIPGLMPQIQNLHTVGRVRTVFTANGSNYGVHDQIREIKKNEVVVVFAHECADLAILGDLIARYTLLHRRAAALVVDGLIRDAARIRLERHPVWAAGVSPLGCVNEDRGAFPKDKEADLRHRYDGGIATCDDGGVVVIPADCVDEDMLERLQRIELQEDIWSYCLNTLKWDTKKIICDRAYLEFRELLPPPQQGMVDKLQNRFTKRS